MTRRRGEQHPRCVIPDALVVRMRDLYEHPTQPMSAYKIARLLKLPVSTVKKIVYYQRRTIVPLAPERED